MAERLSPPYDDRRPMLTCDAASTVSVDVRLIALALRRLGHTCLRNACDHNGRDRHRTILQTCSAAVGIRRADSVYRSWRTSALAGAPNGNRATTTTTT